MRFARHDYTQALDCLFRAGFWDDAAYIAERVLRRDELQQNASWLSVIQCFAISVQCQTFAPFRRRIIHNQERSEDSTMRWVWVLSIGSATTITETPRGNPSGVFLFTRESQTIWWLNALGITGIILKYRVPRRPDQMDFH